jgi:hypothetical protein
MNKTHLVLDKLRQQGTVDYSDFAKGFRLAARIFDLRQAGHEITSERLEHGARYRLVRKEAI